MKKRPWQWLLFPFKFYRRPADRRRPDSLAQYTIVYENTLSATLDTLEHGFNPDILPRLVPVYLDLPVQDMTGFPDTVSDRKYRDDLESFIGTLRQTRLNGAWAGFVELMTVQPRLCLIISRRVHDLAMRYALMAPHADTRALPVGPTSIYALIVLNNLLCLHHLIETTPTQVPSLIRPLITKQEAWQIELKSEINIAFKKMLALRSSRKTGDLIFLHSMMPLVAYLRDYEHLVPYLNRLAISSPMTFVDDPTDTTVWAHVGDTDLSGIELLLDPACPFYFLGAFVQRWVDALLSAEGDEQRRVFSRIERIIDYLGVNISRSPLAPRAVSARRCLMRFARAMVRSWPDEQCQQETFGMSPEQSMIWHDILTRILRRVDGYGRPVSDDGQETETFLAASDYRMLQHAIVLAQRSMVRAAS